MEYLLIFALLLIPVVRVSNPAPSLVTSKTKSRTMECERLDTEAGLRAHPGVVVEERPRGDFLERSALVCRQRLMQPGEHRTVRDDAILSDLDAMASEMAVAAAALQLDRTWVVETYYPHPEVSTKLSFATKNALVSEGLSVSDRVPMLAAGDIDVLVRMPPDEAYPAACKRYHQLGGLDDDDALLAVVSRDQRATILNAGLCIDGQWRWLR